MKAPSSSAQKYTRACLAEMFPIIQLARGDGGIEVAAGWECDVNTDENAEPPTEVDQEPAAVLTFAAFEDCGCHDTATE